MIISLLSINLGVRKASPNNLSAKSIIMVNSMVDRIRIESAALVYRTIPE